MLWKVGGGLLVAGLLGLLLWLYGGAKYRAGKADGTSAERTAWQDKVVQAERDKLTAYRAGVASVQRAEGRYIETVRDRVVPLTRTIIERSTAYAQTPAGAAICLAPDRVSWLDQQRAALFTTAAARAAPVVPDPLRPEPVGEEPRRVDE